METATLCEFLPMDVGVARSCEASSWRPSIELVPQSFQREKSQQQSWSTLLHFACEGFQFTHRGRCGRQQATACCHSRFLSKYIKLCINIVLRYTGIYIRKIIVKLLWNFAGRPGKLATAKGIPRGNADNAYNSDNVDCKAKNYVRLALFLVRTDQRSNLISWAATLPFTIQFWHFLDFCPNQIPVGLCWNGVERCFEIRTYPLVETSSFEEHFKVPGLESIPWLPGNDLKHP